MKIAFDLRPLQIGHQNRGIGAYILNILQSVPKDQSLSFVFLRYDSSNPIDDFNIGDGYDYKEVVIKRHSFGRHPIKLFKYGISGLLPTFYPLRRHRPDVFVQCDYLLGAPRWSKCRVITVAYDLIPLKLKPMYLPSWKKYIGFRQLRFRSRVRLVLRAAFYERKYKNGVRLLRRSARVISISKNTTNDLVSIAGINIKKISTIYLAASFRKNKQDTTVRNDIKKLVNDMNIPYIAYVGATDRRRQVEELVYAFNLYNARQAPVGLILGGNEFRENSKFLSAIAKKAILSSSYKNEIHMLGRISEAEKHYILEHASAFVYPTLYEGFGLPLLEAMESGCPVITYNNSSIPEIAGKAALYLDKPGGYEIYKSLVNLLNDKPLSKNLRDTGIKQAKKFTWKKSGDQFWSEVIRARK